MYRLQGDPVNNLLLNVNTPKVLSVNALLQFFQCKPCYSLANLQTNNIIARKR